MISFVNKYLHAAGNVIANTERNITRMTYDYRNLAQHIGTDTGLHQYTCNTEGLRLGKQYSPSNTDNWPVTTRYVYGAWGELIAQYTGETPQFRTITTGTGETLGRMDTDDDTRYYYLKDHLGSVRVTLKDNGTAAGADDYYPFGLQMPGRNYKQGNEFDDRKFTGHFLEQEGGLGIYHAGARMYDPEVPRFYGVDAMAGDFPEWSPYNYALNNPIVNIDPDGEFVISFISGFIRGLREDDATFRSAVSEGWQSVKNTAQIWSSFGRGDFGQIVSKFTWELPQQLAGVTTGVVNNWFGNVRSVSHSEGATLVETQSYGWGGFTLGSVIHAQRGTEASASDNLFVHEYGHYLQSRRVGPAYLPVIGVPSLVSAAVNDYQGHKQFWTERWADRLSERHFNQSRLQPNLPKTPEQRRQEELRRMMLHMRR